ncbi:DNA-binding response regulator [Nocardiopsis gilva YIM 90087]|uniref:DNA-binding response regulator n=1 Tax=Nocardiopsis gilva YIM 90087 TaxID=1235441 RepID=A0A223SA69_9ACTN|nr:response regulator transcription factor [Nocardiopsis gilva]ASU85025.1 DNA-binding response regulator [Nocardiopsis gilva YIM 90087]
MTCPPHRALVVDDNLVVRAGLVALLEATGEITVIGEAGDGQEAIDQAQRLRPDVILLDVRMPLVDGITAVEQLVPIAPVLMLTHTEDPEIIRTSLQRGASGYLVHGAFSIEELNKAVANVVAGDGNPLSPVAVRALVDAVREPEVKAAPPPPNHPPGYLGLTQREMEILNLIAKGLTNRQIAEQLFLTEKTVKNHVNRIFTKLQVSSRAAAIARWNGTDEAS